MPIPALLLTGGASRRMGSPKALLEVDGVASAQRAADLLKRCCSHVIEVGPGYTDLESVLESPVGAGPLAAFIAGSSRLDSGTPILLLACDMPEVSEELLYTLANYPTEQPPEKCVIPIADGQLQTLCARYSATARSLAPTLWESGARSLRSLLEQCDVEMLDESTWGSHATSFAFNDLDTPEDLQAYLERRGRA